MDFGREPELIIDAPVEKRNLTHPISNRAEAEPIRFDADETVAPLETLQRLRQRAVAQKKPTRADLDRRAVDAVDEAGNLQSAVTMQDRLSAVPPELLSRRFEL